MNSETRNKLRKAMWKVWAHKQYLNLTLDCIRKPWWETIGLHAQLMCNIKNTPWKVFHISKPEIDEHRAKAWHRLEQYKNRKLVAEGKVFRIEGLSPDKFFTGEAVLKAIEGIKC